ncbi:helix-turn-helix transcriptional regulator [Sinanaerobacter sp. ZZT-01]|uniref:helix-turn-helix transcriptional regulator n=1 Tax=Sinanaerobacter sp. ZZT-01 TaxID=3111540 RepID=UPI002D769BB9|nr:helix-turn-helix transcriptional regulator [Sinanaerobacter sp. ZZT-01]WRR92472.1 helix-turn-helix transcriptional regulator [Sinanaerobacter sp. ZZT-01]
MKIDKRRFEICLANKNLLINDVCDATGLTRTSVTLAIQGKRNTRPQTIGKIARALEVPVEEIIKKDEV